jgi:UDPglucose 6-dehydrogenase
MVKHGVNAFLATCVTFANELAIVSERVGADAAEVERALRLEPRIGARAYIKPGTAFAGGTLARDVVFLNTIAGREGLRLPRLDSVLSSNEAHKHWPVRRIGEFLGDLSGRTVAVLGLAYKPGTNTLRRSSSFELCRELASLGVRVKSFDPAIEDLPSECKSFVTLAASAAAALSGADAAIIATEWPEFKSIELETWLSAMRGPLICYPNGFLAKTFEHAPQRFMSPQGDRNAVRGACRHCHRPSQGLGEEVAKRFVGEGASLLLCARGEASLNAVEAFVRVRR